MLISTLGAAVGTPLLCMLDIYWGCHCLPSRSPSLAKSSIAVRLLLSLSGRHRLFCSPYDTAYVNTNHVYIADQWTQNSGTATEPATVASMPPLMLSSPGRRLGAAAIHHGAAYCCRTASSLVDTSDYIYITDANKKSKVIDVI